MLLDGVQIFWTPGLVGAKGLGIRLGHYARLGLGLGIRLEHGRGVQIFRGSEYFETEASRLIAIHSNRTNMNAQVL